MLMWKLYTLERQILQMLSEERTYNLVLLPFTVLAILLNRSRVTRQRWSDVYF
jgi:hypothetical protein